MPGFRPGKAPRRLLEARMGTDIAREQALRDSLPEFYVDAVTEHDVDVIAPPEIEVTAGQEEGDVEFEAVVEVRPQVHLIGYDELQVELPSTRSATTRSTIRSTVSATASPTSPIPTIR